jgi:ribosomal protein S18 acetylase RimI-like enzyme
MEQIREYNPSLDESEIVTLLKEFQVHLATVDREDEIRSFVSDADARRYLEKMVADSVEMNGKFLVLELDGKLIGFIQGIIDPRNDQDDVMYQTTHNAQIEGWIGLVYVRPEYRGRRFGIKLIEAIKQHFIANGCTTLRLLVASDNADTVNFYHKYGFIDRDIEMAMSL